MGIQHNIITKKSRIEVYKWRGFTLLSPSAFIPLHLDELMRGEVVLWLTYR